LTEEYNNEQNAKFQRHIKGNNASSNEKLLQLALCAELSNIIEGKIKHEIFKEAENSDADEKTGMVHMRTFAQKLMNVLSFEYLENIITWLPDGNAFIIINQRKFTEDLLPRYFEVDRYESFVRKLYRWGFKRVPRIAEGAVFYHRLFLRDQPHLCNKMRSYDNKVDEHHDDNSRCHVFSPLRRLPSTSDSMLLRIPAVNQNTTILFSADSQEDVCSLTSDEDCSFSSSEECHRSSHTLPYAKIMAEIFNSDARCASPEDNGSYQHRHNPRNDKRQKFLTDGYFSKKMDEIYSRYLQKTT